MRKAKRASMDADGSVLLVTGRGAAHGAVNRQVNDGVRVKCEQEARNISAR